MGDKNSRNNIGVGEGGRERNTGSSVLTVNENDRLLDGVLVAELRVQQGAGDKRAVVGRLVPADVKMVDVDVAEAPHHLHLILDWEGDRRGNRV